MKTNQTCEGTKGRENYLQPAAGCKTIAVAGAAAHLKYTPLCERERWSDRKEDRKKNVEN